MIFLLACGSSRFMVGLMRFLLLASTIWLGIAPGEVQAHWAFEPVSRPALPEEAAADPIAWFVDRKLTQVEVKAGGPATRRAWVRRLHVLMTGLSPSPERMEELVASKEADDKLAGELVEELLASPRFGERWARMWLDVARYSDTKGYAYSPEEFNFPHAWVYRDWVIKAFNEDLPFDQFVQRQLAADLLLKKELCDRSDLAAMGFLTLGRRFISVEPDIIDDRIDVTTRGLLGLTVSCARCHDHKFDPIPTADYYALYGVFKSSREGLVPLDEEQAKADAELKKRKAALTSFFKEQADKMEERYVKRVDEYLIASLDLSQVPPPDFAEIIEDDDLNPAQIRRWYEYLSQKERRKDTVLRLWLALAKLQGSDSFETEAARVIAETAEVDPLVKEKLLAQPLKGMKEVAKVYARLFQEARGDTAKGEEWKGLKAFVSDRTSPLHIARDYIHDVEWLFTESNKEAIKKRLADVERQIIALGEKAPHALVLRDRKAPLNMRVFERGQYPLQPGPEVKRGSLGVLHGGKRPGYAESSGRLALAREITAPTNPLTARVIVNRIWRAYFGTGLVRTDSDFGLRSDKPSHPELLDYLASELVEHDWSLKHVHRLIAKSAILRREVGLAPESDPENRFLSVISRRRLDVEAMRDAMLQASGELDLRMGGLPGALFGREASPRRSIYGRIDRQYLPSTLTAFDFANPELHAPRRYRTNVPQQALFLMNSPFAIARSEALMARLERELPEGSDAAKLTRLFRLVYGRAPSAEERKASVQFLTPRAEVRDGKQAQARKAWSYGYGEFDPKEGKVGDFKLLPLFNGEAWGGGEKWPDSSLGWVRLTALGGHTGNDRAHAAVRRWTAPVAGTIDFSGSISKHEGCGDGIRAWVSSSRQGVLGFWEVQFGKPQEGSVKEIIVEKGEELSFVVDCGAADNFSCDGFDWAPVVVHRESGEKWDAQRDFGGTGTEKRVTTWVRLAQALMISNEAMYLD